MYDVLSSLFLDGLYLFLCLEVSKHQFFYSFSASQDSNALLSSSSSFAMSAPADFSHLPQRSSEQRQSSVC